MYENTILNALNKYHTHIQTENAINGIRTNPNFINRIIYCEEYIKKGNEVSTFWMKENYTIVSKAIKFAHDSIHRNYIESDEEYSSVEHKELNICMNIFKDFFKENNIDINYMEINF